MADLITVSVSSMLNASVLFATSVMMGRKNNFVLSERLLLLCFVQRAEEK
jgi:hypothetical protein